MKVYVSHNFGGEDANRHHVELLLNYVVAAHARGIKLLDVTPVSPIHALGFMYNQVPYEEGMRMCLDLLKTCDMMIFQPGYDTSKGVKIEKAFCLENGIRLLTLDEFCGVLAMREMLEGGADDQHQKV